MNRQSFQRLWSAAAWILLLASWFYDFLIFGINPFFVVIGMWIFGGVIARMLFGQETQTNTQGTKAQSQQYQQNPQQSSQHNMDEYNSQQNSINSQPTCPGCGSLGMQGDRFCQYCGTTLEEPAKS